MCFKAAVRSCVQESSCREDAKKRENKTKFGRPKKERKAVAPPSDCFLPGITGPRRVGRPADEAVRVGQTREILGEILRVTIG